MLPKAFAIALLAATGIAAPYPNETAPYSWTVQKFNGTCSAAACWAWGFSISGAAGRSGQPAFETDGCSIDSRVDGHQQCRGIEVDVPGGVAVQIDSASIIGGLLTVQYTFQQGPIRYTYYGNHSVTRRGDGVQPDFLQPTEFLIVPHAASAIGMRGRD
ncbi:uncharacterized protein M421DRAFT_306116 [Didymella exigua CBS 183.55]|uniref:Cell wall protein YJL171C/Tos1 C-terminal domain-containing protein n=1 Tax=Didymella exigua CBS 183.55 TaxID=1150837 RepID=A0A6A5R8X5_9PLEO|nr:uncharacterized protein M421DRAFT_306116 [Didymella exigua CBS 183.55]KAF1923799.1 hypothetical protein M421DRAFT_306116 [Didymella exigua CBS 183.55]